MLPTFNTECVPTHAHAPHTCACAPIYTEQVCVHVSPQCTCHTHVCSQAHITHIYICMCMCYHIYTTYQCAYMHHVHTSHMSAHITMCTCFVLLCTQNMCVVFMFAHITHMIAHNVCTCILTHIPCAHGHTCKYTTHMFRCTHPIYMANVCAFLCTHLVCMHTSHTCTHIYTALLTY